MTKKTEPEAEQDQELAPFAAWLRDQNGGRTHTELTEAFHKIVAAVTDTGKAGTLTLTIKVSPFRGEVEMLQVDDRIATKIPQHDRKTALWYPDPAGNLHRNDPRQDALDLESMMER